MAHTASGYDSSNPFVVYHLPAYVALQRWATGRTVVVVEPSGLDGPRRLRSAGARRVVVVGGSHNPETGIECVPSWNELPRTRGTIDLALCIERYAQLEAHQRHELLTEARARLGPPGVFAAWAPHGSQGIDFWTLEEEFRRRFRRVFMLAELPWRGVSLAPVLDDHQSAPQPSLGLDESLLDSIPTASHYLAIGTVGEPSASLLTDLTGQCLLVPVPGDATEESIDESREFIINARLEEELTRARAEAGAAKTRVGELEAEAGATSTLRDRIAELQARIDEQPQQAETVDPAVVSERDALRQEVEELQAELEEAQSRVTRGANDLTILTNSVRDLEQALDRATELAGQRASEVDAKADQLTELAAKLRASDAERASVAHQLELALTEREGARQLATRVEAELELSRRRLTKHEEQLAAKIDDTARFKTDAEVARSRAEQAEEQLTEARSREERLSASAAENAEQGRVLAEVAVDRDRLREELGRRSTQISELEDRLWTARDEVQKERLDNVRLSSDTERLRDQAERSRQAETDRAKDVQRLSAELHKLELERADLLGVVRSRKEDIERLQQEATALANETDEVAALHAELNARGRELGELTGKLESARGREQEAVALARKRESQLSEVGVELERLRTSAEEHSATASGLQGELDVKALEVEQLAASVSDLQSQLGAQRRVVSTSEGRKEDLQKDVERAVADREELRRKLRTREQELEDLVSAHESSGVEVYKLRRELEAAAQANEQLEEALGLQPGVEIDVIDESKWPEEARSELKRVKGQLAAQSRRHAEQLAARDAVTATESGVDSDRLRRLRLEIDVRGQEQEHMLSMLDSAEQRIWEMTDAADRNAARLAASLAQLERHKEELDETRDELEVTRKLLNAAQARALEQERLLASERAKLARVGADASNRGTIEETVDVLFADLDDTGGSMVDLGGGFPKPVPPIVDEPAVPTAVSDRSGSGSDVLQVGGGPRVVVEAIDGGSTDGEDPWERGVIAAPNANQRGTESGGTSPRNGDGAELPEGIATDGPSSHRAQSNKRGT